MCTAPLLSLIIILIRKLFQVVYTIYRCIYFNFAALGGLVVSVLVTGPMRLAAAGSGPTVDGGFLWTIKIRNAHFLPRGSKGVCFMSQIYGM
jgi:hypothetical protein